jgi:Secretion system C-terminal sorting domain
MNILLDNYNFAISNPCLPSNINLRISKQNNTDADICMLFPNPASDLITIKSKIKFTNASIYINDLSGRILKQVIVNDLFDYNIDVSEFLSGLYMVRILNENAKPLTMKFEIQK